MDTVTQDFDPFDFENWPPPDPVLSHADPFWASMLPEGKTGLTVIVAPQGLSIRHDLARACAKSITDAGGSVWYLEGNEVPIANVNEYFDNLKDPLPDLIVIDGIPESLADESLADDHQFIATLESRLCWIRWALARRCKVVITHTLTVEHSQPGFESITRAVKGLDVKSSIPLPNMLFGSTWFGDLTHQTDQVIAVSIPDRNGLAYLQCRIGPGHFNQAYNVNVIDLNTLGNIQVFWQD